MLPSSPSLLGRSLRVVHLLPVLLSNVGCTKPPTLCLFSQSSGWSEIETGPLGRAMKGQGCWMYGAFSFFPCWGIYRLRWCWPRGGTYVDKVKLLLLPIIMGQFLVCIHLCYCNFLTGFWSSGKGILVHMSLLNWCFCGDEGLDFLFCHLADVTLCLMCILIIYLSILLNPYLVF